MSIPIRQYRTTTANLALLASTANLDPGAVYFDTDKLYWYMAYTASAVGRIVDSRAGICTVEDDPFSFSSAVDKAGDFDIGTSLNRFDRVHISAGSHIHFLCYNGTDVQQISMNIDGMIISYMTEIDIQNEATGLSTIKVVPGGLQFPATQVESSNANTLDDYEEGDWAPDLLFGGTNVDMAYSLQDGTYTKIGRHAFVTGALTLSAKGSSTGAATIAGLPFTVKNDAGCVPIPSFRIVNISFADFFQGYVSANTSAIVLEEITNAGTVTNITNADFGDTSSIRFSLNYVVV